MKVIEGSLVEKNHLLILMCGTLCASVMLWWVTPLGVGVSPDSEIYIGVARSILAGDGFQVNGWLVTHYPPMYPMLLVLSGLGGVDPLDGARWINILVFGGNVFLVGLITLFSSNRSITAALVAIAIFASSSVTLEIHAMAWSEAPFVLFSLMAFYFLISYLIRQERWLLVISAFFVGIACITRYIGVTLLLAMIFSILIFEHKHFQKKIREIYILLIIGLFPLALYILNNIVFLDSATGRHAALHAINIFAYIKSIGRCIYFYYLPIFSFEYNFVFGSVFLLVLVFVIVVSLWPGIKELFMLENIEIRFLVNGSIILFCIIYLSMLFISISFFDASTHIDSRILFPLYVLFNICIVSCLWNVMDFAGRKWAKTIIIIFIVFSIFSNLSNSLEFTINVRNNGLGYTDRAWRNSETIQYVMKIPNNTILYSNDPYTVHFLTKKRTRSLPRIFSPTTRLGNSRFNEQMQSMRRKVINDGAVIVYFDNVKTPFFLTDQELEQCYAIPVLLRLRDGIIFAGSFGKRVPGIAK